MATRDIWAKRIGSTMAWTFHTVKGISGKIAAGNSTNTLGNLHNNVVRRVVPNYHDSIREDLKYTEVKLREMRSTTRRLLLNNRAFNRKNDIKDLEFILLELNSIEKAVRCVDSHLKNAEENK